MYPSKIRTGTDMYIPSYYNDYTLVKNWNMRPYYLWNPLWRTTLDNMDPAAIQSFNVMADGMKIRP